MQLIIWRDDHGLMIYRADTKENELKAVMHIIQTRLDNGYLDYPDEAENEAKSILADEDLQRGLAFLAGRNDHEYEFTSFASTVFP